MALAHSPKIVTDGLVLCLDAANPKSYPGSGTAWTDLSGNGNNGTLVNGPTFNSANGGSIVFDGVNDLVNFGNNTVLYNAYNTQFTQEYVVRVLSGASTFRTIFRVDDWIRFTVEISTADIRFTVGYSSPTDVITYNTNINYNIWYHISIVWIKQSKQQIYLNGILVAERTPTVSSYTGVTGTSGGANLGRGHDVPFNNNINADIALFKHYTRALSAEEIQQNFNALRGRYSI
jgi:hypothetical protein